MIKNADKTRPHGVPVFLVIVVDTCTSDSVRTCCCLFVRKSRTNSCSLARMLYSDSLPLRIQGYRDTIKGGGVV